MDKNTQNIIIGVAIGYILATKLRGGGISGLITHTQTGNMLPGVAGRGWGIQTWNQQTPCKFSRAQLTT